MGWKSIKIGKRKKSEPPDPNQPDLFSEPVEPQPQQPEEPQAPKPISGRTEHHWYKGYTASGESSCSTHPSECPQKGRVQPGDKMVVIGPIKGVLPSGVKPVMMYCHEGKCAETALAGADRRIEKRIGP